MATVNISPPPKPSGSIEQQINKLYRHMAEQAEQLNYILSNLEMNNFTEAAQKEIKGE